MATKDAPIVTILQFDERDAYDHDRPISSLIRTQLLHLHHAENLVVPPNMHTNININHLLTELQASQYIQKVTALLHKYGHSAAGGKSKTGKRASQETGKTSRMKAGGKKAIRKSRKGESAARKRTSRK